MKRGHKPTFFIVTLVILVMTYLCAFGLNIGSFQIKGAQDIRFGIDIRGGVDVTFVPDGGEDVSDEQLASARAIIETRLDSQNITDREVTVDTQNDRIIVRFPWKSDEKDFNPEQAISELGETAELTFRHPTDGSVILDGSHVKKATAQYDASNGNYVLLEFDDEGAELFAAATAELVGSKIGIYMDETLISDPTVNSAITGGNAIIEGISSQEECKDLADKISAGALPFKMVSQNYSSISPTLGQGALDVMLKAGLIAFVLICIFMVLVYRLPGVVAVIALLGQVVGAILAVAIPQFTLTLPGIAGIILSIGMGVDCNVIIAERTKEEIRAGRSISAAVNNGFERGFTAIFDSNITMLIVAVLLWVMGSGSVMSFGYTLFVGVIFNFIMGVTATRLMTLSLVRYNGTRRPWFFGAKRGGAENAK